ncbi:MAG: 4Fe-4S binding protein, partial [Chloroflexi bacterium]|nr:4Fe-4S binding protein [Chloroflexota bacterium]
VAEIDPLLCAGCGICRQLCPAEAISPREKEAVRQ